MKKLNVNYLHLGDFIFWDEQKQTEFIIDNYNWKINKRYLLLLGYQFNKDLNGKYFNDINDILDFGNSNISSNDRAEIFNDSTIFIKLEMSLDSTI